MDGRVRPFSTRSFFDILLQILPKELMRLELPIDYPVTVVGWSKIQSFLGLGRGCPLNGTFVLLRAVPASARAFDRF